MIEFERIAAEHREQYPQMQPRDLCKLAYQNEFGCGHLVKDAEAAKHYLFWEAETVQAGTSLIVPIGNGYSRIDLGCARDCGLPLDWVLRMFLDAAAENHGSAEQFEAKARLACKSDERDALEALLDECRQNDYAPFSHTETYRQAYHPAYRVIKSVDAALVPLLLRVKQAVDCKRPVLVGLDGRCGAGKTTLAQRFSAITGYPVVHADDFFLPVELRTSERLATPGGNVHYERLIEEVLKPAIEGEAITYGQFSCSEKRITKQETIQAAKCLLVEGSYSLHLEAAPYYTIKAFCDISTDIQRERIRRRNGEDGLQTFVTRWIPLEEAYFKATDIKNRCDLILTCE